MIDTLVISRNRSSQLLYFLSTMAKHVPPNLFNLTVLYNSSDEEFQQGYDIVKDCCQEIPIKFIYENNFPPAVLRWLSGCTSKLCTFFCDDDLFFRPVSSTLEQDAIDLFEKRDPCCLSLRLGLNINACYRRGSIPIPEFTRYRNFYLWDWQTVKHVPTTFGRVNSVDGHIYTRKRLNELFTIEFEDPNHLEGVLSFMERDALMACLPQSVVVNNHFAGHRNNNMDRIINDGFRHKIWLADIKADIHTEHIIITPEPRKLYEYPKIKFNST